MVHRNYRKAAAVVLASLLLICTLALAACGGTSGSTSNTANSAQTPATTTSSDTSSAPTTDSPTASAAKIKNIDQQLQDASTTLDTTKKDADTAGQQNSENDQNP
ncbi:hypothetical protein KDW_27810 [Dictyobacter vulcani]|uniref:Uncharacterized protein n=1 Tax=Dictyobacter vulcani TaxID=2607529 RepID=A0A5J4KR58_9CHLR|nr:hypothetical protein [Dictyobacter vulcani]GER88619.1 hypothetical protein KDW_27810 [Dictyobacter vulcani]